MRTSSTDTASQSSAAGNPATPALEALRESLAKGGPSLMDFITHSSSTPEGYSVEVGTKKQPKPKPDWMKMVVPGGDKYASIKSKLRELKLNTVCEEARCPNIGECWTGGETGTATATIMILGDTCTRGCRYVSSMTG
jgi:lipoic acid synthetase